jgi:hypothetical protein
MGITEIWAGLKSFFDPGADALTKEKFDTGLKEAIEQFRLYGIPRPEVFYVYNGLFTEDIRHFLEAQKGNMVNFFFPGSEDDYVAVLGAEQDGQKYILFRVYDEHYERRVGNYMRTEDWPDLGQEVKRMDEILGELYARYGSK